MLPTTTACAVNNHIQLHASLQEALTRVCSGTAHYSAARTLSSTEQPLFAAAAKALCDLVVPYSVSCYQRIYPDATATVDADKATKSLREVIDSWDQEAALKAGAVGSFCLICWSKYMCLLASLSLVLLTLTNEACIARTYTFCSTVRCFVIIIATVMLFNCYLVTFIAVFSCLVFGDCSNSAAVNPLSWTARLIACHLTVLQKCILIVYFEKMTMSSTWHIT